MSEAEIVEELRAITGAQHVLTAEEDLLAYGYDGTWYVSRPLAVVLPGTAAEVSAIHKLATRERIAITPRAMGSGLSGGAVPLQNSLVLGVMRMNHILEIDEVNRVAVVQAGVINADLQRAVEARGLFYPPDPSSLKQSAIGGNVSENAGGARCLKYGVTGDYVAALEVVLPGGEIIRTGGKMVKNVTGYDLRRLFTGAEGTLGTITEITLRLLPKPKFARTATAAFAKLEDAARTVTAIIAAGFGADVDRVDGCDDDSLRRRSFAQRIAARCRRAAALCGRRRRRAARRTRTTSDRRAREESRRLSRANRRDASRERQTLGRAALDLACAGAPPPAQTRRGRLRSPQRDRAHGSRGSRNRGTQ